MSTQSYTNTNTNAGSTIGSKAPQSTTGHGSQVSGTNVNSRNSDLAQSDWSTAKLESESEASEAEDEDPAPSPRKKDLNKHYGVPKSASTSTQDPSVGSSKKKSTANLESDDEEHVWPPPKKGESKLFKILPGYADEAARLRGQE